MERGSLYLTSELRSKRGTGSLLGQSAEFYRLVFKLIFRVFAQVSHPCAAAKVGVASNMQIKSLFLGGLLFWTWTVIQILSCNCSISIKILFKRATTTQIRL